MKTAEEIQALRDRRFELWTDTKRFLDENTDENGQISDEVVKEFTRREKKVEGTGQCNKSARTQQRTRGEI